MEISALDGPRALPDPIADEAARLAARADARANPLTVSRFAAVVTPLFFGTAFSLVTVAFLPRVPSAIMQPWLIFGLVFLFFWIGASIALLWRRPGRAELVQFWGPVSRVVVVGSNLIVLATAWLFIPHADTPLRIMLAGFYVGQIATQIAYSPENAPLVRAGIAAICGSAAFNLVALGGRYEQIAAVFLLAFGMAMFVVADTQRGYMRQVIDARFAAEDAQMETQAALSAVAEARDAKTRFIAAASHDLGQPLQAAALFFDQAMRAPDPDHRNSAAEGVKRAFASAEQLLSHMLNHLQLEADAVRPHISRMDLDATFRRLAAQYAPLAADHQIALCTVQTRHHALVDPALFDRALGNLISNAIQHSGGTRVLVGARRRHDTLDIWVIDNGAGIGSADAGHVFEDYYRGSDSQAPTQGGFGLGLSSVKRIAELLGGHAGLDRRWLHGAAFFIQLPHLGGERFGLSERRLPRP